MKNSVGILIGTALNIYITLGDMTCIYLECSFPCIYMESLSIYAFQKSYFMPDVVGQSVIPAYGKLRQEDLCKSEAGQP